MPAHITVNNIPLPWVDAYKHLGHWIHSDEDMGHDLMAKRGQFISKVHALRQELGQQYPEVFIRLVTIYRSSFYGSNLWDLSSGDADKLWSSWNTLIRSAHNLPYATHRYILNDLQTGTHLKTKILSRFLNFDKQISKCDKPIIKLLYRKQKYDHRSIFGKNYMYVSELCGTHNISEANVFNIEIFPVPPDEKWRTPLLVDLLRLRDGQQEVPNLSSQELALMINNVCCT